MIAHPHASLLFALTLALFLAAAPPARAQTTTQGVPNALQGFSQNRNKPVKIEATSLEVREKDKVATFLGNVNLVQGDTTLKCATLVVHYERDANPGTVQAAQIGTNGQGQIRRLEAKGGVIVTQKDQTATGENGVFDMKSNTVTLHGKVVVTQGENVVRGSRLVVDLTTGVSRVECDKSEQCRVQALIQPGSNKEPRSTGSTKDQPKAAPSGPLKLH
jgi:lipopolysaccharide export system protein LptA